MSRNYDKEIQNNSERNYEYHFDTDVIHPFMLKAVSPFIKNGNALELGCYKGAFTERILPLFDKISCVDASKEAIDAAQIRLNNDKVRFLNNTFENVVLKDKFSNIFLMHVLEHLELNSRIELLSKINNIWLDNDGVVFIACPNANAPSRQIAVKMGLISHNSAVTEGEWDHGHRVTYSFDTLEQEIKKSGLKIIYRTGIFFKAFANFQWDKILDMDIVSPEFLNACFELGQVYPDLSASILFICIKGDNKCL